MRTAGAECHSNTIDAEALLRFTLRTLKQLVARHGNRDKLQLLLLDRARRAAGQPEAHPAAVELRRLRGRESMLRADQEIIEYRLGAKQTTPSMQPWGASIRPCGGNSKKSGGA